jgi:hypothetical protein
MGELGTAIKRTEGGLVSVDESSESVSELDDVELVP